MWISDLKIKRNKQRGRQKSWSHSKSFNFTLLAAPTRRIQLATPTRFSEPVLHSGGCMWSGKVGSKGPPDIGSRPEFRKAASDVIRENQSETKSPSGTRADSNALLPGLAIR